MTYLIDGYNLLFGLGFQHYHAGSAMLERARTQLLSRLAQGHARRTGTVVVVFDASHAPARAATEQVISGLRVRFARDGSADDLIEEIIRRESTPRLLTVVSGDRRIQQAARRRSCVTWTCDDYLDWLDTPTSDPPVAKAARTDRRERPFAVSSTEADEWLRAFGMDDGPIEPD